MNSKDRSENPNIFVTVLDPSLTSKLIHDLKEQGFDISTPPYTFFLAKKKGVSCTFYQSGKLTVQGKEMGQFIEFYLEPTIIQAFPFTHKNSEHEGSNLDLTPHIGIDESGKGDFFGPLCVAGVFASKDTIKILQKIGVRDSKTLSDPAIKKLGLKIRESCLFQIVKINPYKYNELILQFKNLNRLLAWGHATAIEQLSKKSDCKQIIIDQFADEHVVLNALKRKQLELAITQRHRGEEDIVVAAASILARCAFVEGIELLEKEFGLDLPKGASQRTISAGRNFIELHGKENLPHVAKMHFKTLDSILDKKRE